jgi:hypothetical protein
LGDVVASGINQPIPRLAIAQIQEVAPTKAAHQLKKRLEPSYAAASVLLLEKAKVKGKSPTSMGYLSMHLSASIGDYALPKQSC